MDRLIVDCLTIRRLISYMLFSECKFDSLLIPAKQLSRLNDLSKMTSKIE